MVIAVTEVVCARYSIWSGIRVTHAAGASPSTLVIPNFHQKTCFDFFSEKMRDSEMKFEASKFGRFGAYVFFYIRFVYNYIFWVLKNYIYII